METHIPFESVHVVRMSSWIGTNFRHAAAPRSQNTAPRSSTHTAADKHHSAEQLSNVRTHILPVQHVSPVSVLACTRLQVADCGVRVRLHDICQRDMHRLCMPSDWLTWNEAVTGGDVACIKQPRLQTTQVVNNHPGCEQPRL